MELKNPFRVVKVKELARTVLYNTRGDVACCRLQKRWYGYWKVSKLTLLRKNGYFRFEAIWTTNVCWIEPLLLCT